jgi:hypothetical protein
VVDELGMLQLPRGDGDRASRATALRTDKPR